MCLKEGRCRVSKVAICYASLIIESDIRTTELSNAALHIKQDTISIEK